MLKMMNTESLIQTIKNEAEGINSFLRQDLAVLKPNIDPLLYELLEYGIFNGGKRVRPLLVVLASRFCGVDDEGLYRLACAFEYLHCATLFHDDIIDDSETRRGNLSVHIKYGRNEAILAGDFLHAYSMAMVGEYAGKNALSVFCKATTGMVDGEFLQLRNAGSKEQSEAEYYETIIGKTALLISAACEIGGLYAGCDQSTRVTLRQYGNNLGCAFQIVDDLLDYTGDSGKTGKSLGKDLAEGKMTLPLIMACQQAQGTKKKRLLEILADKEERLHCFWEVHDILAHYDCFIQAKNKAEVLITTAIKELRKCRDELSLERDLLENLARFVLSRNN